jgi:hypothetical protein
MCAMPREYRRTDAGRHAWDTQDAAVPLEYRRVLGLIGHGADTKGLRAKLGWSEAAVRDILEELQELGMVEPVAPDLDFTGRFTLQELQSAQPDGDEVLDFTGALEIADLRAALQKKGE